MKCLHCGYCCLVYDVIIVNPNTDLELLDLNDINIDVEKTLQHKPSHQNCPHLLLKNHKFYCKIHNRKWYKDTPCYRHSQIENGDTNCRMGEYILNHSDLQKQLLSIYHNDK